VNLAPLPERFRTHLHEADLLAGPARVLLGVSGGADSFALLDLAAAVAPERRLELIVVHADHGIHPGSGRVAATVAATAQERYGLEPVVGQLALGPGTGETRARAARYRFFRAVQRERGAAWLATAHHADDQVETVLLRLLRGSAPAGLGGIPERGPGGLVRPLLPFTRAELAAHAAAAGLPVFDDPANRDVRHMRSWVRTVLRPLLDERTGGAARAALLAVAAHAADEAAAWDAVLDRLPGLDVRAEDGAFSLAREVLGGYENRLAGRILRAAARRAGVRLGPAAAARAALFAGAAASGRRLALGEGLLAEAAFDRLVVSRAEPLPEPADLVGERGSREAAGWRFEWSPDEAPAQLARTGWTTWVTPGPLAVRAPRRGDRVAPLGGAGRRTVSRLLMEARVPRVERERRPVLVRGDEVLWVPGICRAAAALPAPGTRAVRIDAAAR
jgi:tRNA(Ile)-lysidine synthase